MNLRRIKNMFYIRKQNHAAFALRVAEAYTSKASAIRAWPGELLRWILLFPPLWVLTRPKIHGSEQFTGNGPYIFVANHTSHLDTPLLLAALPLRLRLRLRAAAAADYFFTSWWKGALVTMLFNAFSFERRGFVGLHCARQLLKDGYSVLLFPEGTRSKDGQLQPFKCGIGRLALATHVCVVPVWIEGAHAAMPKGAHLAHKHLVEIRFGAPLQFEQGLDQASVVAAIEQQVRALAPIAPQSDNKGG
jgi:1-acyl-sn-glycerol-3-phosphate acyltransferase